MARLLIALVILLSAPATAMAATPTCPADSEEYGPGPTFGIGPEHVLGGVPERASVEKGWL